MIAEANVKLSWALASDLSILYGLLIHKKGKRKYYYALMERTRWFFPAVSR